MDIFINGKQGRGKTRAAETIIKNFRQPYGTRLSDADVLYLHDVRDLHSVRLLVEMIRAARVRAVVFDESIHNGAHLLIAVQAIKEVRTQINADILAIYVQQAEVTSAKDIADNMPQLLTTSDRARIEYLGDVNAELRRYPLTWDNKHQAFEAANLEDNGQVICSAVNVYAFTGALKDGTGKRAKRFMLFELAEVVPVSNLHVAVDKMNTHYFEHGTFERRAFNEKNVRPATPSEVLEYLNAKYTYTLKNS